MEAANALLAAVPLRHLESGLDICVVRGSVIFGSDRYGLFEDRGVEPGAPVYLYASFTHEPGRPMVTWQASYVRFYRHEDIHEAEALRRPATTDGPGESPWVVFWEVRDLRKLDHEQGFPVSDLAGEDGRVFNPTFIPHGPVAVRGQ